MTVLITMNEYLRNIIYIYIYIYVYSVLLEIWLDGLCLCKDLADTRVIEFVGHASLALMHLIGQLFPVLI